MRLSSTKRIRARRQRGYVLLVIMLFATAMVIGSLSIARLYVGQIKRERELELIHRGTQYSRAVKKFYKKFNRYPSSLDQLENTNQVRFLRRRYKDPMTGKDFKLLHFGEVQLQPKSPNAATNPGVSAASLATGDPNNPSTAGGNPSPSPITSASGAPVAGGVGGAPIIGVESTSKKVAIFEFNNKNHYNEWEFIYDPSIDRGGLIKTPYNGQTLLGNIAGQPGAPGIPTAPPQTRLPGFLQPGQNPNPNMTPQPQAPQSPQ